jgi:hypothetical protein
MFEWDRPVDDIVETIGLVVVLGVAALRDAGDEGRAWIPGVGSIAGYARTVGGLDRNRSQSLILGGAVY